MFFRNRIFQIAFGSLFLTYVLNKVGLVFGLYTFDPNNPIPEYDSIAHFFGGATVSLGIIWFYFYSEIFNPINRKYLNFFIISLSGVILIMFLWESLELFDGSMNLSMSWYFYDTALDITFGTLGAVVGCIIAFNQEKLQQKWKIKLEIPN